MIELSEWARTVTFPDRPWLILGKGPSFSRRGDFDISAYNLFALNHTVREVNVDIAHAIDIEVVIDCADALHDNCRWLIVAGRPHRDLQPGPQLLEDYLDEIPVLKQLDREGRLIWYSAATAPLAGAPIIDVKFFSSEAALSILGTMGVKTVRSLGLDGGTQYSASFRDLDDRTRLSAGHASFDLQFKEMNSIIEKHSLDYEPLVEPMRVFVGADESQMVAARTLEYSIKKHAAGTVEFVPLLDLPVPKPRDKANRPRTGFSFYRFMIPELCGYAGRALYLDADMQVFGDISELWSIPLDEKTVLCTYQSTTPSAWKGSSWFHPGRQMSVMMLDCSRLDWKIEEIITGLDERKYSYGQLMFELCIVPEDQVGDSIPAEWNSLEHYEEGKTKLLHYTVVPTQPWKSDDNPLGALWENCFAQAVAEGAIDQRLLRRSFRKGHLKPSLARFASEIGRRDSKPPIAHRIRRRIDRLRDKL